MAAQTTTSAFSSMLDSICHLPVKPARGGIPTRPAIATTKQPFRYLIRILIPFVVRVRPMAFAIRDAVYWEENATRPYPSFLVRIKIDYWVLPQTWSLADRRHSHSIQSYLYLLCARAHCHPRLHSRPCLY